MKIIVTGNARSGSSFVTNLIHVLTEYNCGPTRQGDKHNKFGYWENVELNNLNRSILNQLGLSYVSTQPSQYVDFSHPRFNDLKYHIKKASEGIELYKDNVLMIMPELYQQIFPDAKWVYTSRSIESSYKSRFGDPLEESKYNLIVENRLNTWKKFEISNIAKTVEYEKFDNDLEVAIQELADYLEVKDFDMEKAKSTYRIKEER